MSIKFKEALENEIVSDELIKNLPKKCKCGSEIVFSDSLKTVKCSNKNCVYATIDRFISINKKLNLGMSDMNIENIVTKLGLITPYQIMIVEDALKNGLLNKSDIHNADELIQNINDIKSKEYYLYEIVEMCGIPTIANVAKTIFEGFDSVDEVYEEIYRGQLSFISERLGLLNPDSSTFGVEIYNQLNDFMEEIAFAELQFKIKKYSENKLNIAFSDNIIPYFNKKEYIEYINGLSKYKFNFIGTISEYTDILIKNSGESNSKNRAARIINDKYIADMMNSGKLELSDINKVQEGEIKPLGSKIYVCSSDELVHRLNELGGA